MSLLHKISNVQYFLVRQSNISDSSVEFQFIFLTNWLSINYVSLANCKFGLNFLNGLINFAMLLAYVCNDPKMYYVHKRRRVIIDKIIQRRICSMHRAIGIV